MQGFYPRKQLIYMSFFDHAELIAASLVYKHITALCKHITACK